MSEETTNLPPKAINPLGTPPAADTLKVKPVLRKPGSQAAAPAPAAAPAAANAENKTAVEQLKKITQNLKSITAPIPQQAILRNTGVIAGNEMTEKQRAAAKARTSRISLSDAIGAAPVKETSSAPIKTIRIQRPKMAPRPAAANTAAAPAAPAPAPAAAPAAPAEATASAESSATITQKRTVKVARPGLSAARPKLGIKKAKPAQAAAPQGGESAEMTPVDDIPDMPETAASAAPAKLAPDMVPSVPKGVAVTGLIFQFAACAVIGLLAYYLYLDTQLPIFCGGCMP